MFTIYDSAGKSFCHPDGGHVLCHSSHLWKQSRICDVHRFVDMIKQFFTMYFPHNSTIMSLESLCHPMTLIAMKGKVSLVVTVQDKNYLLPNDIDSYFQHSDKSYPGYNEEEILCSFVSSTYPNINCLAKDVDVVCRSLAAHGKSPSNALAYLHNTVVKCSRMPYILQSILMSPLHTFVTHAIFRIITCLTRVQKKPIYIVNVLCGSIHLDNESEWTTVNKFRDMCGLSWHGRHEREVTIRFGTLSWTSEWQNAVLSYKGKMYRERLDQRIVWMSVLICGLLNKRVQVKEVPSSVLVVLARLMAHDVNLAL